MLSTSAIALRLPFLLPWNFSVHVNFPGMSKSVKIKYLGKQQNLRISNLFWYMQLDYDTLQRIVAQITIKHSSRMRTAHPIAFWIHTTPNPFPRLPHCILGYTPPPLRAPLHSGICTTSLLHAGIHPPWTEWQTRKNITLPQTSFVCGNNKAF